MTLVNDLYSVEDFIKARFPTAATVKQTAPMKPDANLFVIRFQNESRETETAAHFRSDREFQITYYGTAAIDVLTKLDALSTAFYQTMLIPIKGSLRYIRVKDAGISQPFKTDNDTYAGMLVLSTEIRQARTQESYEKIAHVYFRKGDA